jgi:glycosyltransferase involved in cell wall biosynthesis
MKLGFDAKRAFLNKSGLGNYSRNILDGLAKFSPEINQVLFSPKIEEENPIYQLKSIQKPVLPSSLFHKTFKSYWRTKGILTDIKKEQIEIYHGLSNELPLGIEKIGIKTIVTIHDLIFIRYAELYKKIDREIYRKKFKSACERADVIIAISQQTKEDIITYFGIKEEKIRVLYQNCNPIFYRKIGVNERETILAKYDLPRSYFLNVGTIEPRKNVLSALKAWQQTNSEIPFVIIGKGGDYLKKIQAFIAKNNLENQVYIRHNVKTEDLPAIYQNAFAFIYPSIFEGFGIPILEAMQSGTPVISSLGTCFEETGGNAAQYTNPDSISEIKTAIQNLINSEVFRKSCIEKGYLQAEKFSQEKIAMEYLNLYKSLL